MNYRLLAADEIELLERRGSSCADWTAVEVAEGFDAECVRNCRFSGKIRLGAFKAVHRLEGGLEMHSGLSNASLNNVVVGNDVLVSNVSGYISDYEIGEGAVIMGCGFIFTRSSSVFGCGTEVSVLDETGSRMVRIFPGLSSQLAWLAAFDRRPSFQDALGKMIDGIVTSARSDYGHIGSGTVINGAGVVDSVNFGDRVSVCGALSIKNGTVASGCVIGSGVILKDFIMSSYSRVDSSSRISDTFIGEAVVIDSHFSSQNSLIFSNCHFENGEICAAFAGPHTVAHHKSILLIGGLYSFFNAGSGANHSNHLYSLGPKHFGILERGCKLGSDAYIMLPARVGAYSLVIGRHHRHRDSSAFPFSYIIEKKGHTYCMPGAVLSGVGLFRDVAKWPKRDRRPGGVGTDRVIYDLFTPGICDTMIRARKLLQRVSDGDTGIIEGFRVDALDKGDYVIDGMYFTPDSILKGIRYYSLAIAKALGDCAASLSAEAVAQSADLSSWTDVSGLVAPEESVREIADAVAGCRVVSIEEIEKMFGALYEDYPMYKASWAALRMKQYGIGMQEALSGREEAVSQFNEMIAASAKRDLALAGMFGGESETPDDSEYSCYYMS